MNSSDWLRWVFFFQNGGLHREGDHFQLKEQFLLAELTAILEEPFASCLKCATTPGDTLNASWQINGRTGHSEVPGTRPWKHTCTMLSSSGSSEYNTPYHGSVWSVFPSNLFVLTINLKDKRWHYNRSIKLKYMNEQMNKECTLGKVPFTSTSLAISLCTPK